MSWWPARTSASVSENALDASTLIHWHGLTPPFDQDGVPDLGSGALAADTVWLPPHSEVTVAFDASNPGTWALHCDHLYHMATGMMTTIDYAV